MPKTPNDIDDDYDGRMLAGFFHLLEDTSPSHPDAALLTLCREMSEAEAVYVAAAERQDEIEFKEPLRPRALLKTEEDHELFESSPGSSRLFGTLGPTADYTEDQIRLFRRFYPPRAKNPPKGRGPRDRKRAQEIVQAWDDWQDAIVKEREACGLTQADKESGVLCDAYYAKINAICRAPARTIEGLALKAVIAKSLGTGATTTEDIEEHIGEEEDGMAMIASILRDLVEGDRGNRAKGRKAA